MAFQVSPGVQVKEIDLTSIIPSVSTTRAGFAGFFNDGPVGSRVLISSVNQLRSIFGDPTEENAVDFFSAANFLAYTNNLQVVRVVKSDAVNPNVKGSSTHTLIKTVSDYDGQFGAFGASSGVSFGTFAARSPGGVENEAGNALQLSVCDRTTLNIRLFGASGAGPLQDTSTPSATLDIRSVPTSTDTVFHFAIDHAGFTNAGLTINVADGQLDIANVGASAGDNLRLRGVAGDQLRVITGLTPGFVTTIDTQPNTSAVRYESGTVGVHVTSTTDFVGKSGGYALVQGRSGGSIVEFVARISDMTEGAGGQGATYEIKLDAGTTLGVAGGVTFAIGDKFQLMGMVQVGSTLAGQSGLTAASVDWRYRPSFSTDLPATSVDAESRGASFDLMHVAVVDEFGLISESGNTFEVLEAFDSVSKASNVKDTFGANLFHKDVIRRDSGRVFVTGFADVGGISGGMTSHSPRGTGVTFGTVAASGKIFNTLIKPATFSLTGGTLGGAATSIDRITDGYDLFADPETVDVNILVGGGITGADALAVRSIVDKRRDCIAFFSPPQDAVLDSSGLAPKGAVKSTANAIGYRTGTDARLSGGDVDYSTTNLNIDTSFAVIDSGWKLTFDRYNDKFRYIPLNADTAGVTVRTDIIAEPWFSPAGFNRGQILGAVSLAYSPSQAQRDDLYTNNINPVVSFPGQGTVLFGDKTMQKRASAFDRINVRRLFIILEKAIATAAKFQLFEINDAFTRAQFKSLIDPFLRDVQARRGIVDFKVICDESNNPSSVVDANQFVASIFIKPSRAINFITLNFVATGSGVNFQEIGA